MYGMISLHHASVYCPINVLELKITLVITTNNGWLINKAQW